MAKDQQETLSTIQASSPSERRTGEPRFPRALNLAEKAKVLAEELVKTLR
jgi:hypothetical protein